MADTPATETTVETPDSRDQQANEKQSVPIPAQRRPWTERCGAGLNSLRSAATNLVLILLIAGLIAVFASELFRKAVSIEAIQVPKDLAERGYSPEVVAQRLGDKILEIRRDSQILERLRAEGRVSVDVPLTPLPEKRLVDIDVPGTKIPIRSLLQYLREFFGIHEETIQGEITRDSGQLRLRLRMGRQGAMPDPPATSDGELDELLRLGAREVVKSMDPYLLAAYYHGKLRDRRKALEMVVYCLKKDPRDDDPYAYNLWGNLLRADGNFDDAIEKFQAAIRLKPDFAMAYTNWGQIYTLKGEYDKAVEKFNEALKINSRHADAYFAWAALLNQKKSYKEAREKYRKVVEIEPGNMAAQTNVGLMLAHERDFEGAVKIYREIVLKSPGYAGVYFGWSKTLWDQGNSSEAIEQIRKAIELDPTLSVAHNNLGFMLLQRKNIEDSIKSFQEAIKLSPNNADAHYNWGRALLMQDRQREALDKYRKALSLAPGAYEFLEQEIRRLESKSASTQPVAAQVSR